MVIFLNTDCVLQITSPDAVCIQKKNCSVWKYGADMWDVVKVAEYRPSQWYLGLDTGLLTWKKPASKVLTSSATSCAFSMSSDVLLISVAAFCCFIFTRKSANFDLTAAVGFDGLLDDAFFCNCRDKWYLWLSRSWHLDWRKNQIK